MSSQFCITLSALSVLDVAKHMRMAENQFLVQRITYVGYVKLTLFVGNLGIEQYVQ